MPLGKTVAPVLLAFGRLDEANPRLTDCQMCKVTKVIHLEQVTFLVKRIELNPTCSVGNILPVPIAVVLFDTIGPSYGGLGLERHDLSTL